MLRTGWLRAADPTSSGRCKSCLCPSATSAVLRWWQTFHAGTACTRNHRRRKHPKRQLVPGQPWRCRGDAGTRRRTQVPQTPPSSAQPRGLCEAQGSPGGSFSPPLLEAGPKGWEKVGFGGRGLGGDQQRKSLRQHSKRRPTCANQPRQGGIRPFLMQHNTSAEVCTTPLASVMPRSVNRSPFLL